jgi:hypothetical protein
MVSKTYLVTLAEGRICLKNPFFNQTSDWPYKVTLQGMELVIKYFLFTFAKERILGFKFM